MRQDEVAHPFRLLANLLPKALVQRFVANQLSKVLNAVFRLGGKRQRRHEDDVPVVSLTLLYFE